MGYAKRLALVMVLLLGVTAMAQDDIGLTINNDFVSDYFWRGYDTFDDHASWQPSIDYHILDSGWHVNVWFAQPISSGNEELTELNYTVYYENSAFEGEMFQTDYFTQWIYYDFPKANSDADAQEVGVGIAMPQLFGDLGLTPSYYVGKFWLSDGGNSGGFHIFALDYTVDVGIPVDLTWDLTYNDGVLDSDHDWSHSSITASTDFEIAENFSVTPFVAYQQSFEKTVNDENEEVYGGISTSLAF